MTAIKKQQCIDDTAYTYYSQVQLGNFLDLRLESYENQPIKCFDGKSIKKNETNINIKEAIEEVVGKENLYITKMEKEDIISQIAEEMEKYHSNTKG